MNVNQQQVEQIKELRAQALKKLVERNDIENEANMKLMKDDSASLLKSVLKKNLTRRSRRELVS
jgi:hypothetical protein